MLRMASAGLVCALAWSGPHTAGRQAASDRIAHDTIAIVLDAPAATNHVWPGYSLPSRSFAIQTASGIHLHTTGPAPEGFTTSGRSLFRPGAMPGLGGGISISHAIGDLRVTVVPVAATPERTAQTLYHEAFHAFQREHPRARTPADAQSLAITADQAASIEVERRVLAEALRSLASPVELLREALAVRRERTGADGAALAAAERSAEWREGLADYVAHHSIARAMNRSAAVQRLLVARSLTAPLATMGGSPDERLVRGRGYATGAAFGFLLDQLRPGWPNDLADKALDELAAELVSLQPGDITQLAAGAKSRHGYDTLRARRDPPWGSLAVMSEEAFFGLAPYRVVIVTTPAARQSFSLTSRGAEHEGMHRPVAGVLLVPKPNTFRLTDGPLELTVKARPVRVAGPPTERDPTFTILLPSAPMVNGKSLPAGDSTLPTLDLSGDGLQIKSSGPVSITVDATVLTIRRRP